MQINYQDYKTNFSSRLIAKVKLLGNNGKTRNAVFSELIQNNIKDEQTVQKLKELWTDNFNMEAYQLWFNHDKNTQNPMNFFCISVNNYFKTKAQKIVGVAATKKLTDKVLELTLLLGKPNLNYNPANKRPIKGIGENLFAQILELAQKEGIKKVDVYVANRDFFIKTLAKAGLNYNSFTYPINPFHILIESRFFEPYIKYVHKKYKY